MRPCHPHEQARSLAHNACNSVARSSFSGAIMQSFESMFFIMLLCLLRNGGAALCAAAVSKLSHRTIHL